ncbi:MAG: YraN family protein [Candidatus Paceibacterota bacterium]|jgi:putative endonuclease
MANIRQNVKLSSYVKGNKGEDIACKFIENKGFHVICRNYMKSWGELDIIAEKDKDIHFFEVKSVTSNYINDFYGHKPEENVDGFKVRQIRRMVMTFLEESGIGLNIEFNFHVLCVYMNMNTHLAKVKWMKNIIL